MGADRNRRARAVGRSNRHPWLTVLVVVLGFALIGPSAGVSLAASGAWGSALTVTLPPNAGTIAFPGLGSVACPASGSCVAVGSYYDSSDKPEGMVVSEVDGSWGSAVEFTALPANASTTQPSSGLGSIACTAPGSCVATGWYIDSAGNQQAMVATESAGVWAQAIEILPPANVFTGSPGRPVALGSVSCRSAGSCVAFGQYADSSLGWQAMVTTETEGSWGATSEVTLPPNAVASDEYAPNVDVACPTSGACVAVGEYPASQGNTYAMVLSETSEAWGAATEFVPPSNLTENTGGYIHAGLHSVTCPASGSCLAVGSYTASAGDGAMVATYTGGSWGAASEVDLLPPDASTAEPVANPLSVACPASDSCVTAGWYRPNSSPDSHAMIASETDGSWNQASAVSLHEGIASGAILFSVACPPTEPCVAVGDYGNLSQAMIVTEASGSNGEKGEGPKGGGSSPGGGSTTTTSSGTTPPPAKAAAGAAAALASSTATVKGGNTATVKLTCTGAIPCSGKLTLTVKRKTRKAREAANTVTIGSGSFSIPPGKTGVIRVKLNATGRTLLSAAHGRLNATLTILTSSMTPATTQIKSVRLVQAEAAKGKRK